MTKFETMDNMNTNFVTLTEDELVETEGGIGIVAGALIVGGVIYVSGVFVGYTQGKKP